MKKAKIFYFTLQDEQTKEEKLDWFADTKFDEIPFDHITPDQKGNWINLTDNDFDDFLPLVDKDVKEGKSDQAVFILFSRGVETTRDEWVYDFDRSNLEEKIEFFLEKYNLSLEKNEYNTQIKWSSSLEEYAKNKIKLNYQKNKFTEVKYRPYIKQYFYADRLLNHRLTQNHYAMFSNELNKENFVIWLKTGSAWNFFALAVDTLSDLLPQSGSQCLPLYRYDENRNRIDNITDWGLEEFRRHYQPSPPQPPSPTGERGVSGSRESNISTTNLSSFGGGEGEGEDLSVLVGARRNIPEELLQRARELRLRQTPAEKILWECLRGNRLFGFKFRRQHNIGQYIADFYCHAAKLVIELDGEIHQAQTDRDSDRDSWLEAHGLTVLRFKNNEITENLEPTLQSIISYLPSSSSSSSYPPSPVGEGQGVRATIPVGEGQGVRAAIPVGEGQGVREISAPKKQGERATPTAERTITKLDIFHYTYAVLHHPAYRKKYELNLKREFPRLPFYNNFFQWVEWGNQLMDLHLNYETIEPYGLTCTDATTNTQPKAKLKADKEKGYIDLDGITFLQDIPAIAWDYKLGNRSALEWILDQYKEKKPKDPTIAKLFNTYCFADYKEHVIDLLQRVCTISVKTMEIIRQMPDE